MPKLFDFATSLDDVCQLQLVRALSLSLSLSLSGGHDSSRQSSHRDAQVQLPAGDKGGKANPTWEGYIRAKSKHLP